MTLFYCNLSHDYGNLKLVDTLSCIIVNIHDPQADPAHPDIENVCMLQSLHIIPF